MQIKCLAALFIFFFFFFFFFLNLCNIITEFIFDMAPKRRHGNQKCQLPGPPSSDPLFGYISNVIIATELNSNELLSDVI